MSILGGLTATHVMQQQAKHDALLQDIIQKLQQQLAIDASLLMTGIPHYSLGGSNGNWQPYSALHGGSNQSSRAGDIGTVFAYLAANFAPPRTRVPREGIRAGEITAYRAWRVNQVDDMLSITAGFKWLPGEPMIAKDRDLDCDRGVYCFKAPELAINLCQQISMLGGVMASGSVEIWGDIIEHSGGYRAQFAAIKSIDAVYGDEKRFGFTWPIDHTNLLDRLRKKYRLDAPANDL